MPGQFLSKACNSSESWGKVQNLTVMAQRQRDISSAGSGIRIIESPDSAWRTAPSSENNKNVSAPRPSASNQTKTNYSARCCGEWIQQSVVFCREAVRGHKLQLHIPLGSAFVDCYFSCLVLSLSVFFPQEKGKKYLHLLQRALAISNTPDQERQLRPDAP